jgi:carbon-monoxide dehydrogenase catalytic subunit
MEKSESKSKLLMTKEGSAAKPSKSATPIDPKDLSIDAATQLMIHRARELAIETVFDRAEKLKPCNIGAQGTCCKNCGMGPCRLPLPKSGIQGEDARRGLCGATPNTIAARNFIRMIAGPQPIPTTGVAWPKCS